MNKSVWAVERGSYSDYHVVGIFSTREYADKIAKVINDSEEQYDKATVAEWLLDPGITEMNAGLQQYNIVMNYDGAVERIELLIGVYSYYASGNLNIWKRTEASAWEDEPISDAVSGHIWAQNDQHAIKIANEFRAQAIAEGRIKTRIKK